MATKTRTIPTLEPYVSQRTVLLTTFKRDGTGVGTPVNIVVVGDHAYMRSWSTAGKMKRIRNNREVELAPSTFRGCPTGPAVRAHVRVLDGGSDEARLARRALARKYPFMHGILVPLVHKLCRYHTVHFEIVPELDGR